MKNIITSRFIDFLNSQEVEFTLHSYGKIRIVHGLPLANYSGTCLPNNLTVHGFLDLDGSNIKSLPSNLYIEGSLFLENSLVSVLPKDLLVRGIIFPNGFHYKLFLSKLTINKEID